jgi:hypothetical protein
MDFIAQTSAKSIFLCGCPGSVYPDISPSRHLEMAGLEFEG